MPFAESFRKDARGIIYRRLVETRRDVLDIDRTLADTEVTIDADRYLSTLESEIESLDSQITELQTFRSQQTASRDALLAAVNS